MDRSLGNINLKLYDKGKKSLQVPAQLQLQFTSAMYRLPDINEKGNARVSVFFLLWLTTLLVQIQ